MSSVKVENWSHLLLRTSFVKIFSLMMPKCWLWFHPTLNPVSTHMASQPYSSLMMALNCNCWLCWSSASHATPRRCYSLAPMVTTDAAFRTRVSYYCTTARSPFFSASSVPSSSLHFFSFLHLYSLQLSYPTVQWPLFRVWWSWALLSSFSSWAGLHSHRHCAAASWSYPTLSWANSAHSCS